MFSTHQDDMPVCDHVLTLTRDTPKFPKGTVMICNGDGTHYNYVSDHKQWWCDRHCPKFFHHELYQDCKHESHK